MDNNNNQPFQQPQYQQYYRQPYQQPQSIPVYPQANMPGTQPPDPYTPEEKAQRKKKANLLCIISLILQVTPEIAGGIISAVAESLEKMSSGSLFEPLAYISSLVIGGSYIASWVLMIIARVKYKESKFAKVLMWVYIGIIAIFIALIILLVALCAYILKDCHGF